MYSFIAEKLITVNKAGPSSTAGTVLAVPLLSLGPSKKSEKAEIFKFKSVTH